MYRSPIHRTHTPRGATVRRADALRAIDAFKGLKESTVTRQEVRTTDLDYQPYQTGRSGQVLNAMPRQTVGIGERLTGTRLSSLDARAANSALQSITTLARLAEAMGQVALPRRPIIYLSPGLPHDDADVSEESSQYVSAIRKSLQQAIGIATRSNVSVYRAAIRRASRLRCIFSTSRARDGHRHSCAS